MRCTRTIYQRLQYSLKRHTRSLPDLQSPLPACSQQPPHRQQQPHQLQQQHPQGGVRGRPWSCLQPAQPPPASTAHLAAREDFSAHIHRVSLGRPHSRTCDSAAPPLVHFGYNVLVQRVLVSEMPPIQPASAQTSTHGFARAIRTSIGCSSAGRGPAGQSRPAAPTAFAHSRF
jgi:hypothetical protein